MNFGWNKHVLKRNNENKVTREQCLIAINQSITSTPSHYNRLMEHTNNNDEIWFNRILANDKFISKFKKNLLGEKQE